MVVYLRGKRKQLAQAELLHIAVDATTRKAYFSIIETYAVHSPIKEIFLW
jgi:hypothetical protein